MNARSFMELGALTSFYGSVVGVVLLLAKELLGKKITPRWHYALWGF